MPIIPGMIRTMAAVPRVHLADPLQNAQEIAALLHNADENGVQLCVFPELSLTGYSCGDLFLQPALLRAALDALASLAALPVKTAFVVGLPLDIGGRLYNCAAVISQGRIVLVPKTHIPDDGSFGERRYFASGVGISNAVSIPGVDPEYVRVSASPVIDCGSFALGVEIGEDFFVPQPPSSALALHGATIIANPSAISAQAGKHASRRAALCTHSARCVCGYVHAGAGYGESTTDMVFPGHAGVYENGDLLAENARFSRTSSYAIADIDTERLLYKRRIRPSFWQDDAPRPAALSLPAPSAAAAGKLLRPIAALPFLPKAGEEDEYLLDALHIQAHGLIRRLEQIRSKKVVLGVSGGLDSTLALLVAALAFDLAGWDRSGIIGITMPGFGTGTRTKSNATLLMERIGCTTLTIPIGPAVTQHFADIGQDPDVHDICYENSQARERTQIVMDYANKTGALALGTGDLSELALGWCTYGGDHLSMYNTNGSVPKTLMRPMVRRAAELLGEDVLSIALDILDTPVSPELIPSKEGELTQRTEDTLGAYALHDFFIYHMMDDGASPSKLFALAIQAFDGQYDRKAILAALTTFVRRFFTQQFKRSCMNDGPKVSAVSFSPRGDWRMPSDAQMSVWMREVDALQAK